MKPHTSAEPHGHSSNIGREPPQRDDGHQNNRRQRRERQERAGGSAVELRQRIDVLHPVVAGPPGIARDGPVDDGAAVEECECLPHEVVVVALAAGQPIRGKRDGHQDRADDHGGQPFEPAVEDVEGR